MAELTETDIAAAEPVILPPDGERRAIFKRCTWAIGNETCLFV